MDRFSTKNIWPEDDEFSIFSIISSRPQNRLPKLWWQLTDPESHTWTIEAYQGRQLMRPVEDQRFSHIHSMLARNKSLTDTPGLSGTNEESKLDEEQSFQSLTGSKVLKTDEDLSVKSETESVYSDASATSDTRMEYLSEFANELVKVIQPYQPDEKIVQRISAVLLDLLKAFALSLGHGSPTPLHCDMMVLIHKNRKYVER